MPIGRHDFKKSTLVRTAGADGTRILHIRAPAARSTWPSVRAPLAQSLDRRGTSRAGFSP
jgi:hypothetical protein